MIDPEKEGTTCFHRELGKNLFNDSHIPDDANLHQHRYDNLKCLWVKCRAATVWNRNEWSPVFRRKMNKNGGWGGGGRIFWKFFPTSNNRLYLLLTKTWFERSARGFTLTQSNYVKVKSVPLQAWTGPEVSRKMRLPDLKTISIWC